MKISEMTNDQAAKALIRLAEPFSRICDDEELVSIMKEISNMRDLGLVRAVGRTIPKFVAYALGKHREDFYDVIGALCEKSIKQVSEMNFIETVKIVQESYDEVLNGFFSFSAQSIKASGEQSHD